MRATLERLLQDARRELFEFDTRGLAVFRVVFGSSMLVYLLSRATGDSLVAFHTDLGVLPRVQLLDNPLTPNGWSVFFASGSPFGVGVLFAVSALCMASFAIGYRTRTSALASLVALVSVDARAPYIVNASMCIAHMIALYAIALPMGRHYSVDAWLAARRGESQVPLAAERIRTLGAFAFRVQLLLLYGFNFVQKDGPSWHDGTALHYVLRDDRITRPLAVAVRAHLSRQVIGAATYGTLAIEALLAIAVISPVVPRACRRFAVVSMVVLHLGIALFLRLGPFPVVMLSAATLLAACGDFDAFDERAKSFGARVARRFGLATSFPAAVACPRTPLRTLGAIVRESYLTLFLVHVLLTARAFSPFLVEHFGAFSKPRLATAFERAFMVPQGFAMFAPEPTHTSDNLVIDMTLANGRHVDPRTHARPDFRTDDRHAFELDFFWQVYMGRLVEKGSEDPRVLERFLDYVCRIPVIERWPGTHRVRSVKVYYVRIPIRDPSGRRDGAPSRNLIAQRVARGETPASIESTRPERVAPPGILGVPTAADPGE